MVNGKFYKTVIRSRYDLWARVLSNKLGTGLFLTLGVTRLDRVGNDYIREGIVFGKVEQKIVKGRLLLRHI